MPTLDLTEQEIQLVLNMLALQNPLVFKITQQMREQSDGSSDPQRRPPGGPAVERETFDALARRTIRPDDAAA